MVTGHIETKLARTSTLPALPAVVVQVINLLDDPNVGAKEYERIILQDPALTAKMLRTANSALYGGGGRISSLQRALSHLGATTIRSICMTVAFQAVMHSKQLSKGFNVGLYWQHSLGVACGAKVLAAVSRRAKPDEAFIAGLMHDIGKLAVSMLMPAEADAIHALVEKCGISHREAEQKIIGTDHQAIGKIAVARWELPSAYIPPVSAHHSPGDVDYDEMPLLACIHVANLMAHEIGIGYGAPGDPDGPDPAAVDYLGIPEAQYDAIRNAVAQEVMRASESYKI